MKTTDPKQDSQNRLRSPMPEGGEHLALLIMTLFRNCEFQ